MFCVFVCLPCVPVLCVWVCVRLCGRHALACSPLHRACWVLPDTHTHKRAHTPQAGYPCLSLHGGKDQSDRECTIADFKAGVGNILIATSVAARGLDVRDLVLVSGDRGAGREDKA